MKQPTPHTTASIEARFEGCIATSARVIDRVVMGIYDEALRTHGVRSTQVTLLVWIGALGQPTARDLTPKMRIDQTTLSRNIDKLEQLGLVQRLEELDGRLRPIELTRAGRGKLKAVFPAWCACQEKIRGVLGEGLIKQMVRTAGRLATGT